MRSFRALALAAGLASAATASSAITYDVNLFIGNGAVVGTVETDGTVGTLTDANIVDWAFTLFANSLANGPQSGIDASDVFQFIVLGTGFSATATELSFDFDETSVVLFQGGNADFVCFDGIGSICDAASAGSGASMGVDPSGATAEFQSFSGSQVVGTAVTVAPVPLPAGLPLLAGALGLLAVARRRRVSA